MRRILSFTAFIARRKIASGLNNHVFCRGLLQNVKRLKSKPKPQEFEVPRIERDIFEKQRDLLIGKLEGAFNEVKEIETRIKEVAPFYDAEEDIAILHVRIDDFGLYVFKFDNKDQILYFTSPVSGVMKYFFDEQNERWISNRDKHLLEELLVRETTKYLRGYLNL
eukprot:TRINITY_DN4387_c0_g1_i1.p1 TRINITY_DN4387_c0_g1~~TRINITY_DN4387_c0_g1_i1.p1  ORF type:complete len:166 (-),score=18.53 TRINITY_DN4387_c0_g1_i1:203-700(-)